MGKQTVILLLAAASGVGYFFVNYEVQTQYENGKATCWRVVPRGGVAATPAPPSAPPEPVRPTVRIATYQLGRLDEAKLANRQVADVLARLLPRFDLIALQGVRGKTQGVLVRLVEQLNAASGRTYDFATCPTQQRDGLEHYSAFVFDRARFDIDRSTVHFVEDRLGRIRFKPLVGSFRVRGPDPSEAFTFTLINVETDPDHVTAELDLLADVFRAVRDNGRNEDDIILLGDLQSDDKSLGIVLSGELQSGDKHPGQLGKLLGITALLSGMPTTTRGANQLDNILLDRRATSEFTGRVDVVDVIRDYELTMAAAQEVSEHLPVWAEFSSYEGGQAGHAAVK